MVVGKAQCFCSRSSVAPTAAVQLSIMAVRQWTSWSRQELRLGLLGTTGGEGVGQTSARKWGEDSVGGFVSGPEDIGSSCSASVLVHELCIYLPRISLCARSNKCASRRVDSCCEQVNSARRTWRVSQSSERVTSPRTEEEAVPRVTCHFTSRCRMSVRAWKEFLGHGWTESVQPPEPDCVPGCNALKHPDTGSDGN